MFDWLISIPGPQFLWIFPLVAGLIALATILLYRFGDSLESPLPQPSGLNELEVALLSGGERQAIQLGLYDLYRQGSLVFATNHTMLRGKEPKHSAPGLEEFSKKLYTAAKKASRLSDLVDKRNMARLRNSFFEPAIARLRSLRLVKSLADTKRDWVIFILGFSTSMLFGLLKLYFGIQRHKPSGYLLLELILVSWLFFVLARPKPQASTMLGRKFIDTLRDELAPAGQALQDADQFPKIESGLLLAAFGALAFNNTAVGQLLQKLPSTSGGRSSGSGGGDGGGGGGSCGGGGCGGCGGN